MVEFEWEKNAKQRKEFDKSLNKTSQMITIPRGEKKRIYDLKYLLAFGHISFDEYEKRMRKLKNDN